MRRIMSLPFFIAFLCIYVIISAMSSQLVKTPTSPQQFPLLVCDQDTKFLEALEAEYSSFDSKSKSELVMSKLVLISNSDQLSKYIDADTDAEAVSAILFNPKTAHSFGVDVVRTLMQRYPVVPFFYLMDQTTKIADFEVLKKLPVHQIMHKPISLRRIVEEIIRSSETFNPAEALALARSNFEVVGDTSVLTAEDLVPILAKNYLVGLKSLFDVYVAIGSGKKAKFLKILRAGDVFSQERVESYISKGVEHFYLPKKSHEAYLKYCDEIAAKLMKVDVVPTEIKVQQVLNYGHEVLHFFNLRGLNQPMVAYANQFAEKTSVLVNILNEDNGYKLRGFIDDIVLYEHGVSTAMIASLLADALDFETDKSLKVVGVASLLHDVGLLGMNPKFKDEDYKLLKAEELVEFERHPLRSYEILKDFKGLDPMVLIAIAQHHERRGGVGYPNQLSIGEIHRLSEIVGISHEFVRIIHEQARGAKGNPIERMRLEAFDGFSMDIVSVFLQLFI